jgi:hypothetical protein
VKRAWKILGAVVAAIAIAFGALVLWIWSAENRRWNEMGALAEELAVDAGKRDGSRPVLRGDPLSGDAWQLYGPLIQEYDKAVLAMENAGGLQVRPGWKADAVEALRRGVRRGSARNPYGEDWARGEGRYPMDAMLAMGLAATDRSREARLAGKLQSAAAIALDAALYARDLQANGNFGLQEGACQILIGAFEELLEVLHACGTDRDTPRQIAAELENLDRALTRSGHAVLNELARSARTLRREEEEWEWWGIDIGGASWRQGFSRKIMAADGFSQLVAWIRRHLDDDDVPWGTSDQARERFLWDEVIRSPNGLLEAASHFEPLWASELRPIHARLHLLRLAALYLATGDVAKVADPFGTALPTALEGGTLRAWTVGSTRDNQGTGEWENFVIRVKR